MNIIIYGPTGSGKSLAALTLAQHIQGHIINADSMQIYDGMPILSAQPTQGEQALIPHHLYGIVPLENEFSVGKWVAHVKGLLEVKNRPYLFVGGTGLYIKALTEGLSPIPHIHAKVREEVESLFQQRGIEGLAKALSTEDPLAFSTIDTKNPRRTARALEVMRATGKSLIAWQKEKQSPLIEKPLMVYIAPPREALYPALNHRTERMIEAGVIQEVRALGEKKLSKTALKTIGFIDIQNYLLGQISQEKMIQNIQQHTRNYAKRQMTWFSNQTGADITWSKLFFPGDKDLFLSKVLTSMDSDRPLHSKL